MGIVVLLPGPAAREGDPLLPTLRVELVIDELRAVVAVEAHEWHRQPLAHVMDRTAHAALPLAPHGFELDPGRRHVHHAERAEVEALGAAPQCATRSTSQKPGRASS